MHIDTLCAKEVKDPVMNPPHVLPIYASSSFVFEEAEHSIRVFTKQEEGFVYGRYGNPTTNAVASKIAQLEQAAPDIPAAAVLTSSGQSAVSTLCMAVLQAGDAILTQGNLYGGTTELFLKVLHPFGVQIIAGDLNDIDWVMDMVKKHQNIKVLYTETPANPTLACYDLALLAKIAAENGFCSIADNTFATPFHTKPLALGFDFVIHSTTKYLNGHGNSIGGAIVGNANHVHWPKIQVTLKLAGGTTSPLDAWLTHNGLKTFSLRMRAQSANAQLLAEALHMHDRVKLVNYPGLKNHASHDIAVKQMQNGFGAMLSFEVEGGRAAALKFMDSTQLCTQAPTLGDLDTLLLHPASSSHLNIDAEQRLKYGITDGLIRVSVGIEHINDLLEDVYQALAR